MKKKLSLSLCVFAAGILMAAAHQTVVQADDENGQIYCGSGVTACLQLASWCTGDVYESTGTCAITCFTENANTQQVDYAGSATCGKGLDDDN